MTKKLKPYTKRVGALQLTVEPGWRGKSPNTWVARIDVDVDIPEYGTTTANIACKHYGCISPAAARAIAINRGHAMLVNHIIARASIARKAMQ